MSKNKYWDLTGLKLGSKEVEDTIKNVYNEGNKTIINLNKHSCNNYRYPKFEVGKRYWINCEEKFLNMPKYKLCEITYIRSGIIFYKVIGSETEESMPEFCLAHLKASPEEISIDLDSDYYELRDASGKMKVNYTAKVI